MTDTVRILYADHPARGRWRLRDAFGNAPNGVHVSEVGSLVEIEERLRAADYDLVVCDPDIPGCEGLQLLEVVRAARPDLPIVVVTADEERALEAVRRGVAGCVSRTPRQLPRLPYVIRDVVERKRLQRANRRAEDELRVVMRARTVMAECSRVLVRVDDEKQLLQNTCRIVVDSGGYRAGWIGLVRHDEARTIQPVAAAGEHSEYFAAMRLSWADDEYGQGTAGIAVRARKPHAVRQIQADPYFMRRHKEMIAGGYRAAAAFPLVCGEEVLGVLGILTAAPEAFDAAEVALLDELARDIGYGLFNLRLRDSRRREERLLNLEHAVTRGLAETDGESAALKAVIRAICDTEDWECGRYWRADDQAGVLRYCESWNVPDPAIEKFIASKRNAVRVPGAGLAGRVWQTGRPAWVADISEDAGTPTAAITRETGMRGAFHFPVTAGGKTLGVLAFNSRRVREPDDRLLEAVRAIGSQVGQFVQRTRAEEVLRESEARFRSLTELSSDVYWEQDDHYRFTSFSDAGPESISATNHRRLGKRRWDQDYVNMSAADWAAHIAALEARQPFHDLELCRLTDRGDKVWITVSGEPVFDAAGVFRGYRGVGREITARKQGELLLALEHAVTRRLAEADSASTAMQAVIRTMCEALGSRCGRYFCVDENAGVLRFGEAWGVADPAVERLIADSRALVLRPGEELAGRVWESGRPLWSREAGEGPAASGAPEHGAGPRSAVLALPIISEGKTIGVLGLNGGQIGEPDQRLMETIRVIGSQIGQFLQRKQVEERMARLAQFDAVTGLPNRHLLQEHLALLLAQARRNDWRVGVLFVDLDRFKAVNDTYGHAAGDALLHQVGARLKECVRSGDTVGRLSGDEFAVVLSTISKANDVGLVAQKIVDALAAPFDLDEGQICISASVGIALYPDDGTEPDALIKNADAAMYRVKERGRSGFQFTTRRK